MGCSTVGECLLGNHPDFQGRALWNALANLVVQRETALQQRLAQAVVKVGSSTVLAGLRAPLQPSGNSPLRAASFAVSMANPLENLGLGAAPAVQDFVFKNMSPHNLNSGTGYASEMRDCSLVPGR